MNSLQLLASSWPQTWYALPLIVAVSLVYAATRHELMKPLLMLALRTAFSITVFMSVVLALMYWLSAGL